MFTNLERFQRQKAEVREEEACCLELLRRRRGFAVCLWVRVSLGLPDFLAVPLQGILILYLLGHQNSKLVVLNFQLEIPREIGHLNTKNHFKRLWLTNYTGFINSAWTHKVQVPQCKYLGFTSPSWFERIISVHLYSNTYLENNLQQPFNTTGLC